MIPRAGWGIAKAMEEEQKRRRKLVSVHITGRQRVTRTFWFFGTKWREREVEKRYCIGDPDAPGAVLFIEREWHRIG